MHSSVWESNLPEKSLGSSDASGKDPDLASRAAVTCRISESLEHPDDIFQSGLSVLKDPRRAQSMSHRVLRRCELSDTVRKINPQHVTEVCIARIEVPNKANLRKQRCFELDGIGKNPCQAKGLCDCRLPVVVEVPSRIIWSN